MLFYQHTPVPLIRTSTNLSQYQRVSPQNAVDFLFTANHQDPSLPLFGCQLLKQAQGVVGSVVSETDKVANAKTLPLDSDTPDEEVIAASQLAVAAHIGST